MENNENMVAVLLGHIDELAGKLALVTKDRDMYKGLYEFTNSEAKKAKEENERLNEENKKLYAEVHPEVQG